MDANQFMDIFLEEANEHLENLNSSLLQLEKKPQDKYHLNEIFRSAHTLKGMSATMGFNKISSLTHEMENLLDGIRRGDLGINERIVDLLFECLDALQLLISSIANTGDEQEFDMNELIAKLESMAGAGERRDAAANTCSFERMEFNSHERKAIIKAGEQGFNVYKIEVTLDDNCMLKSARAFIVFNVLEKYGEVIKSVPAVEDIEDEKFGNLMKLVLISSYQSERIRDDIMAVSEIKGVAIEEIYLAADEKQQKEGERPDKSQKPSEGNTVRKNITGKTVRVDIDRLDNLMNLVSELIIIKTRLEENLDIKEETNANEALEYLERITTDLHDAVMKVRMVPIERVFSRFPRMVRDLSKELNKKIVLEMYGEETEVDRTVIDEIGDPLIHLIRNSIDHGIEVVEQRKKLGKPAEGRVVLRAYHDGNTVVIEVEDDGRGIDAEKVARKAVEKGIYSAHQVEQLSEEQVIQLIFSPGFSTASKVSDLSGRGVGLDVVKTKIESLGGLVELETKKGAGSKFIIRLPLTLAIIQALLVNIGSESYAIPLNSTKEIVTIEACHIEKVQTREVTLLRGEILPLIRLDKELEVQKDGDEPEELTVVVVRKGEKLAGMIVDRLIGQQEIVIKPLGKYLSGITHLAGATILGDGRVSLILDTNSFF